jgi:GNAT superfamily N-acetyltransferase
MINQQSPQPAVQDPAAASAPAPFTIRPQLDADIAAIVALSLRAWQPVFESMARVLGPRLNRLVYPDWAAGQARAVEEVCRDESMTVWVAEVDARPVGFVAVALRSDPDSAEIEMIAVDPDQQNRGVGSALQRRRRDARPARDRRRSRPRSGPPHLREGRLHPAPAGPLLQGTARGPRGLTALGADPMTGFAPSPAANPFRTSATPKATR